MLNSSSSFGSASKKDRRRCAVLSAVSVKLCLQLVSDLHKRLPFCRVKLPTAVVDDVKDGDRASWWLRQPLSLMQQLQHLVDFPELRRLTIAEDLPECHSVTPQVALLVEFPVQQRLGRTPATASTTEVNSINIKT